MWIARAEDGELQLFPYKPYRIEAEPFDGQKMGCWDLEDYDYMSLPKFWNPCPDLKWTDEPIEVFLDFKL